MPEESDKSFPSWEDLYNNQRVETMPWFNEKLDADLEEELERRKITNGRILDLGTGPATQAIQLAERGLKVTGSDVSKSAIKRAKEVYANNNINFIVDNILDSKIKDKDFDYIFDRGCFHVMPIEERPKYIIQIKRILDDRGILFLKCFSIKESRQEGPYKFSEDEIRDLFEKEQAFKIESIKETVYQGTLDPLPKALLVVIKKC